MTRGERLLHFLVLHSTGLSVLCLALLLGLTPVWLTNPYHLEILNLIGLNVIVVLGLNIFIGFAGQLSLGHAAFFGLGAYGSAVLTGSHGFPPWPTMVLVTLAVALVALVIGIPTLRLSGHYLVMATLGFNIVVHTVMVQWDGVTGGPSGLYGAPSLAFFGWAFDTDTRFHYLVWTVATAALMLSLNLVRSGVGRGLAAVAQDEVAAASLGVDVKRAKVGVFVFSAVLASVAGSLYAHYRGFVSPDTFDIFASVDLVIMTVVGGLGSVWGTLFGVSLVTWLPHGLDFFETYKDIAHGLVLVLILIFLPQGLVTGLLQETRTRLARRRAGALAGGG